MSKHTYPRLHYAYTVLDLPRTRQLGIAGKQVRVTKRHYKLVLATVDGRPHMIYDNELDLSTGERK